MLEPFHMKDINNHIIIIIIKFIHISVVPVTVPIHPVYTYFKFYNSHICQHVLHLAQRKRIQGLDVTIPQMKHKTDETKEKLCKEVSHNKKI